MSSGIKFAALAASLALMMSLALIVGCGPKQPKVAPAPIAQAPPQDPARMVALLSTVPPPMPTTARPLIKLDTTAPPEPKPETAKTEPHHSAHHHGNHTVAEHTPENTSPASPSAQSPQVANAQPPEMSPIGQLSPPTGNADASDRHAISEQIDATENGLNAIKRSFTPDEQKTVAYIRTYITRARDALKADDIDGARTLSVKAKNLLGELTKQ